MTNTSFEWHIIASFRKESDAELYFNTLKNHGYSEKDINVFMSERTSKKFDNTDLDTTPSAISGVGTGSAIGGTLGAIAGAILAAGTSAVVPGLGIIVAGPILLWVSGAGLGGITGGIIGLFASLGIGNDYAKIYQEAINDGHVVIAVDPRADDITKIKQQIDHCNGENVYGVS